jgi:hypothetical protein
MPACPASFFTIPNKSEGFPASGNDIQVALLVPVLVNLYAAILRDSKSYYFNNSFTKEFISKTTPLSLPSPARGEERYSFPSLDGRGPRGGC